MTNTVITGGPSKSGFTPKPAMVTVTLGDHQVATGETRGLRLSIGLPPDGVEVALRPTEALMAALGGCVIANVAIAGAEAGVDWRDITLTLANEDAANPSRISRIRIGIEIPAGADELNQLIPEAVRAGSRMFNTLTRGVEIDLTVSRGDG